MTALTLRRHAPEFGTPPERYSVLADGVEVGTIMSVLRAGAVPAWQWSITVVPAVAPTSGTCDSMHNVAAAFRAAWVRQAIDIEAWRAHMNEVRRRAGLWDKNA